MKKDREESPVPLRRQRTAIPNSPCTRVQLEPPETRDQEQMWGSDTPSPHLQSKEQMVNVQGLTETSKLSLGDTRSCTPYGHRGKPVCLGPQPCSSWMVGQRNQGSLGREAGSRTSDGEKSKRCWRDGSVVTAPAAALTQGPGLVPSAYAAAPNCL